MTNIEPISSKSTLQKSVQFTMQLRCEQ